MNFPSPPTIPQVPLNLQNNIPNYLLTRSFQKNLTKESVRHITYPRPVSQQITASGHLFECYMAGYSIPVITIGFSICPIFCTPLPTVTFCHNPVTLEQHIIITWNQIPNILPNSVENEIRNLSRTIRKGGSKIICCLFRLFDVIPGYLSSSHQNKTK